MMQGSGKERYVFMSFPHISINAVGAMGQISRPGRPGPSCACGALNGALADIKATGIKANCKKPGGACCTTEAPILLLCIMSIVIRCCAQPLEDNKQTEAQGGG